MKPKRLFTRIIALLLALWLLAVPALALPESGEGQLALLEEILEYIELYALYPPDDLSLDGVTAQRLERDPELFMSIIDSWLAGDPYQYSRFSQDALIPATSTYGIGIIVDDTMPLGVYVDAFIPGGGAERSGMEAGAQIVSVDGFDITDEVYMDVRPLFLGNRGTVVEVGYINPGSVEVFVEEIRRGPLHVANVQNTMIDGTDIGYISIAGFHSSSDIYDFDTYYNYSLPEAGAKSVIIDLRGNGGGLLEVLYYILDCMLIEEGVLICRLVYSDEEEDLYSMGWTTEELEEYAAFIWEPDNMILLVDGGTASAAEVFAGTLQAYGFATVVGEATYGKAHSQYEIPLSTGDYLVITSGRIELYEIGSYESTGIIPDYEVELEVITGADLVSFPLDTSRALFRQSGLTERVAAMQERLALLGFYRAEPSGVFDDYTLWCLNRFQVVCGLPQGRFANAETLQLLDEAAMATMFYVDSQFDFALELLAGR
ncbi:MAG: hypothetical protein LBI19_00575 [Oscillospiraceae bacterium]|jgi:carboxyl-terminal processing protease|nr:hypothetical protein [Oscillospiraceae bacterium]